jgi:GTP-binding protein Era
MTVNEHFKSGFVNIIGRPNVGKSTLMNALVGENMSIVTHKPQTTRHRIFGILSGDDFQIVFSDTPGFVLQPAYKMHEAMNDFIAQSFEDADVMLFVTVPGELFNEENELIKRLKTAECQKILLINKTDMFTEEQIFEQEKLMRTLAPFAYVFKISALKERGFGYLLDVIKEKLPLSPPYFPDDQLTDRTERFFVGEIIREKILLNYREEIPYASEVNVDGFKETKTNAGESIAKISATIYIARETQKMILLGKNGSAIKKLGTDARVDIEKFLGNKVHLELTVKVRDNWRDDDKALKHFGYK